MHCSLFFELQVCSGGAREARTFHECLEQAQLADAIGYHCIWAVEHHGLAGYSHSSAPEVFLSFVAATTSRVRVGHGCTLLPHRYNHPIRIAERIATLDILSNGRVNWGSAKSGSRIEQDAFEVDRTTLHDQWLEALEIIPKMWSSDQFSHQGRFFNIPPTQIVPKPLQKPHPPMFAACTRPEQAADVGRLGVGALNVAIYRDELLAQRVREYREAVAQASPVGRAVNNRFCCNPAAMVLPDDDQACRYGIAGATYFNKAMTHYYQPDRPVNGIRTSLAPPADDEVRSFKARRNAGASHLSSVIGDPSAARESVSRFVDAGVDELILVMQTGPTPHPVVMQSIRTFGEQVLPHFA
jgi:alkanesulfonate monooxygenase SsuD/methylene tetrahydromethanopterin reductase-like flavin-dependent oxidoreductase (luciferase family)